MTGDYRFLGHEEWWPELRATLYLKFPTAGRAKGLGTGEFDVGPGLATGPRFNKWRLFLEGSYGMVGYVSKGLTDDSPDTGCSVGDYDDF